MHCFCCDRVMETESTDNPIIIHPVYDGLIFRATGNFGSTIFDPITEEEILQVIICDDCVKRNAKRVTHIYNIVRDITADDKSLEFMEDEDGRTIRKRIDC